MCLLRATGRTFDVELFLSRSTLQPHQVTKRTRSISQGHAAEPPARDTAGFRVHVGEGTDAGRTLAAQVEEALVFVAQHREELLRLRQYPGVDDVRLEFPVESRLGERATSQAEYLPPEILTAAADLKIGIEISFHPPGRGGSAAGR